MKAYFLSALCLLLTVGLLGCAIAPPVPPGTLATCPSAEATPPSTIATTVPTIPTVPALPTVPPTTVPTTQPVSQVALLLESMTLREKVGQLFIVSPEAVETDASLKENGVTRISDSIRAHLKKYPVGGFILFAQNIRNPQQVSALNAGLREASGIPPFISVDEEGGRVARLAKKPIFGLKVYSSAAAVGANGDPHDALEMGDTIGAYLKKYGFNLDFAPVADVFTNPKNTVIGNRAFSSDPVIAAQMVAAMAQGLRDQGIIATFKHFPGHGDTAEDSHSGIAVNHKTIEQLLQCEWLPFMEATERDMIMVGHIAVPQITGDQTPATLSYTMVTEILKNQLGFDGLIVTDSLRMGAIHGVYQPGEAALLALEAGCHVLLMPSSLSAAFDAVVAAVEEGSFPLEKLDSIVCKVLEFKLSHGIL
jgi:beta-N-acetylhexosaminidase